MQHKYGSAPNLEVPKDGTPLRWVAPEGDHTLQLHAGESAHIQLLDREAGSRTLNLRIELLGDGAQCTVEGRAEATGSDEITWDVQQIFFGNQQKGEITLRGTGDDKARLEFNAGATLKPKSTAAQAHIDERIILFGKSKAKALPVLRVETDAVEAASHGASVAPIEAEKILYLTSRGLDKKLATTLLKEGFLRYSEDDE